MTPDEQERMLKEVEQELDRLTALYNQYFMGIEKIEPTFYKKSLDRKIYALRREKIKNTALRFRFQMQIQKYNTQSTYWNRVCRQIEQGTYTRHIMLAKRRIEARQGTKVETKGLDSSLFPDEAAPPEFTIDIDEFEIDLDEPFNGDESLRSPSSRPPASQGVINTIDDPFTDEPSAKSGASPPLSPSPAPSKASAVSISSRQKKTVKKPVEPAGARPKKTGLSQDQLKSIYKKYLVAKKRCSESTENLNYSKVAKSLQKTFARSGSNVDFKVVIRNGKAIIKTVKTSDS